MTFGLLVFFVFLAVGALLVVAFAVQRLRGQSDVTGRLVPRVTTAAVLRPEQSRQSKLESRLEAYAKSRKEDSAIESKMVQAGHDSPTAAATFFLIRVSSTVLTPLVALAIVPQSQFVLFLMSMVVALFMGMILPSAMLDRKVRLRQERIRRSVPDALDLLVVCVEAGVSLDAAILRVAREVRGTHPDLAEELAVVNRLTNAGLPRDAALRGLWQRTGVEDLRALVSSLIQSEKWGTSIATVLRVAADTLRRKRRQRAEKKAKMAPLKMTFPLLFFILPALFAVILGPAVVQIMKEFSKI